MDDIRTSYQFLIDTINDYATLFDDPQELIQKIIFPNSMDDIRFVKRKLSSVFHPDTNNYSEELMKNINGSITDLMDYIKKYGTEEYISATQPRNYNSNQSSSKKAYYEQKPNSSYYYDEQKSNKRYYQQNNGNSSNDSYYQQNTGNGSNGGYYQQKASNSSNGGYYQQNQNYNNNNQRNAQSEFTSEEIPTYILEMSKKYRLPIFDKNNISKFNLYIKKLSLSLLIAKLDSEQLNDYCEVFEQYITYIENLYSKYKQDIINYRKQGKAETTSEKLELLYQQKMIDDAATLTNKGINYSELKNKQTSYIEIYNCISEYNIRKEHYKYAIERNRKDMEGRDIELPCDKAMYQANFDFFKKQISDIDGELSKYLLEQKKYFPDEPWNDRNWLKNINREVSKLQKEINILRDGYESNRCNPRSVQTTIKYEILTMYEKKCDDLQNKIVDLEKLAPSLYKLARTLEKKQVNRRYR